MYNKMATILSTPPGYEQDKVLSLFSNITKVEKNRLIQNQLSVYYSKIR